jgi:V8-like Glu-specific endopeptidase
MSFSSHRSVCLFIFSLSAIVLQQEATAVRAIPDDNLAYPVLITLKNGSQGSGFFLNASKASFLVTARHVLFKQNTDDLLDSDAEILSYAKDPKDKGKNEFTLDLKALKQNGEIKRHADRDVAVIRIGIEDTSGQRTLNPTNGVSMRQMAKSGILGVAENTVKRYSDVLTANQVFIFGYPTSLGLKEIPQIDYLRPLLRSGIVAGTNDQTKTLIIDCPAYGGNSGGPVLEVEQEDRGRRMWIIGVVSQFVPAVENWVNAPHGYTNTNVYNSGYTVATPMDFVLELVAQF